MSIQFDPEISPEEQAMVAETLGSKLTDIDSRQALLNTNMVDQKEMSNLARTLKQTITVEVGEEGEIKEIGGVKWISTPAGWRKVRMVYGFWNSVHRNREAEAIAIREDGAVVGRHICSEEGFAKGDLASKPGVVAAQGEGEAGIYHNVFEYVPFDERDAHEGLQAALAANAERDKDRYTSAT